MIELKTDLDYIKRKVYPAYGYLLLGGEPFLFLTNQRLLKRSGKTIHKIALPEIKTIRILEKCLVTKGT